MRILALILLDVFLACVLFIGIQACRGIFETFGSVFSMTTWASMSAKDIWIFLGCMLCSTSYVLGMNSED